MLAKIINVTKQFNKVYHIQRISKLSGCTKVLQTLLSTIFSGDSISYLFLFPELRLHKEQRIMNRLETEQKMVVIKLGCQ